MRNWLLLFALACCWGPSFLFIKIAVEEIPPMTLVMIRVVLGALILGVLLRAKGVRLWNYRKEWRHFLVMGISASALPFFLITFSELYITSSLAAILNGTTPIFTAVLTHFFIQNERLTGARIFGVVLGFVGILFVFFPSLFDVSQSNEWGIVLMLLAALSYGVAMTYAKRNFHGIPGQVGATAQLVAAALIMVPTALVLEKPWTLAMPSWQAWAAVLALAVLGTAIAFTIYYGLVKSAGANFLSTSTLLFPLIGIFLGVTILGEEVKWNAIVGSVLILSGLAIANGLVASLLQKINRVYVHN